MEEVLNESNQQEFVLLARKNVIFDALLINYNMEVKGYFARDAFQIHSH